MRPELSPENPLPDPSTRVAVLIATDVRTDADLLRRQIGADFGAIAVSSSLDSAAADFEAHRPKVLLLAFNSLAKAQQYSLGLYRRSALTHDLPHRTLILCTKEEAGAVFTLCEQEIFDDYILYWPLSHDGKRLRMSVLLAMRYLDTAAQSSSAAGLARQARRIASLETMLNQAQLELEAVLGTAAATLPVAGRAVGDALEAFASDIATGRLGPTLEVRDVAAFTDEARRFRDDRLDQLSREPLVMAPIQEWKNSFGDRLLPHLAAVRDLQAASDRIRPRILLVDDDELQYKLLVAQLRGEPYELDWVPTADAAQRLLARRRPDLILLDVGLPDLSGPDLLRQIRASESGRDLPVIIVSGSSERPVVIDAVQAGATGYIVKPLDRSSLLQRLSAILNAPV